MDDHDECLDYLEDGRCMLCLVNLIRVVCMYELNGSFDYPYFNLLYLPDETPDDALIRMFREERKNPGDDLTTIRVMCHG